MKKTLTVNLGSTVFHIDEDAYLLLEKYLSNLRIHFNREDGGNETMSDIELRISEIFSEKIRMGYGVITIEDVEKVIKRMGKVEDLFENEPHEENRKTSDRQSNTSSHTSGERVERRFFRNPDDKILGGVCGGFAAYMGWDPTPIRLLFFLLVFIWAISIPVYLVLWLIVPFARTATERLQMRGESVTVENIGKTVTDGFEKFSHKVNEYTSSDKPRTVVQKFADIIVDVIGVLVKFFGIFFGIVLLPPLFIVLLVLIAVLAAIVIGGIGGGFGWLYYIMPSVDWGSFIYFPSWWIGVLGASAILLIGIPIVTVIYSILSMVFKYRPLGSGIKWTLLILWLISLFFTIFFSVRYGIPVWDGDHWHYGITLRNM